MLRKVHATVLKGFKAQVKVTCFHQMYIGRQVFALTQILGGGGGWGQETKGRAGGGVRYT